MEALTLSQALVWLLSGGGAGAVAYFLMDKVCVLRDLTTDHKRYVALALSAAVALLAWGTSVLMGYTSPPETWQGWIESAFSVIALAVLTSQTMHGAIDLGPIGREQRGELP